MVMYVLYAKEKKPEEKAEEKTKPEGNRNPLPNSIRLQNGVHTSTEKPKPCEVTKVRGINEKYIYAKQISFVRFPLFFFFFFTINTIGSSLKFQNEIQGQTQEKQDNLSGQSKTKSIAAGAQQY